jgi:tRNA(Ile)-lysidine synthase
VVHRLGEHVARYIEEQRLLEPGDRVAVAVSGGADSVALLGLLLELREHLGIVLSVVHFHHQIRGADADADQQFVAGLAQAHGLELHLAAGDTPATAASERLSLETAARGLRYGCFGELISIGRLDKVATAHTLDDQAETVLLKLLRGAGTRGLAGIYPRVEVHREGEGAHGAVVRPLLTTRRAELREYLEGIGQPWREDASNLDLRHRRNRIRHTLIPVLEREFNPNLAQRLGELAEIARAEEEYWQSEVGRVVVEQQPISIRSLSLLPLALRRRLLRAVALSHGLNLDFEQVEQILEAAAGSSAKPKRVDLGDGWRALRVGDRLEFRRAPGESDLRRCATDYDYLLAVPGEILVQEAGLVVRVERVERGEGWNGNVLSTKVLASPLQLRNWRPGDRFWPAQTKEPKKVKELLQQRHVPPEQRRSWPVILSGSEIVWMRGFPVPEHLQPSPNETEAVLIQETSIPAPGSGRK